MMMTSCQNWHMPAKRPAKPDSPYRQAFATRLEAARIASGFETMREFAESLGVSEARYRRWEAAETEPDIFHLQKIARVTGVSLDVLITGHRMTHNAA